MATTREIEMAARLLASGGLVAFPTETVYGLGADALDPSAVAQVFALKGRPTGHPLIVHLPMPTQPQARWRELLGRWAAEVPELAIGLAEAFWPGPLTIILRRAAPVPDSVTGGLETVGLRVPAHPVAQELLRRLADSRPRGQAGIAAPSANRFGHISPTTAAHVQAEFGEALLPMSQLSAVTQLPPGVAGVILDGGPSAIGVESTIIDLSGGWLRLLRPGAIGLDELHTVMARVPLSPNGLKRSLATAVRAPGGLAEHYAPRAHLQLLEEDEFVVLLDSWQFPALASPSDDDPDSPVLGYLKSQLHGTPAALIARHELLAASNLPVHLLPLALGNSLDEQAHGLYAALREADSIAPLIYAVLPPPVGIGIAIRDRLRRAAGLGDEPGEDGT